MSFRMRATARFRTGATNTTAETSKSAATAYQTIAARIPAATNTVRFARDDPETPPTMDEQIALARKAADKLGVPNARASRCTGSVGTPTPVRLGHTSSGPGRGLGSVVTDRPV